MAAVKTLIDGHESCSIPVDDRGFQYGDGVFETCVLYHGRVELWQRHLWRLNAGCKALAIPAPGPSQINDELRMLCAGVSDGLVKLIITRGSGGRGYQPPPAAISRRIWQLFPLPEHPPAFREQGVRLHHCRTRLGRNPRLAGIKHLNRIEQVLARSEWSAPGIPEGLLQDQSGLWIEGTMSNLFVVSDGHLLTPDLSRCGVVGVMRELVLELVDELGIETCVTDISPRQLSNADEVFMTNSVMRIWPVLAVGEQRFKAGETTRRLAAAVAGRLDGSGHIVNGLPDGGYD